MSLAPEIRTSNSRLFYYSLAYNLGRMASYATAGLSSRLAGQYTDHTTGTTAGTAVPAYHGRTDRNLPGSVSWWLVSAPRYSSSDWGHRYGKSCNHWDSVYCQLKAHFRPFLFGVVWGWLPCGLVYYALLLALSEGSAYDAALFMLMFGLGTLIPMLLASMLAGRLNHLRKSVIIQRISGGLLILMGVVSLILSV